MTSKIDGKLRENKTAFNNIAYFIKLDLNGLALDRRWATSSPKCVQRCKYLLSTYSVPGIILTPRRPSSEQNKALVLTEIRIIEGRL